MDYTEKNRIGYGKMELLIPGKHSLWTRSIDSHTLVELKVVYARGMQL